MKLLLFGCLLPLTTASWDGTTITPLKPDCTALQSLVHSEYVAANKILGSGYYYANGNSCEHIVRSFHLQPRVRTIYLCNHVYDYSFTDDKTTIKDIRPNHVGCHFYKVTRDKIAQCVCATDLYAKKYNGMSSGSQWRYMSHLIAAYVKKKQGKVHVVDDSKIEKGGELLLLDTKKSLVHRIVRNLINYMQVLVDKKATKEDHRAAAKHFGLVFNDKVYVTQPSLPLGHLVTDSSGTLGGALELTQQGSQRVKYPSFAYSGLMAIWPGKMTHVSSVNMFNNVYQKMDRMNLIPWQYFG
jgi:hypothetical protein